MSLQATLNKISISKLPKVESILAQASQAERNQIEFFTLHMMCNSRTAIDDMTEDELNSFQNNLIDKFKINHWI